MPKFDYDLEQPLIAAAHESRLRRETMKELQTLAFSVIYDGRLDDSEIAMLADWLERNKRYRLQWPIDRIATMVEDVVADGIIDYEERVDLLRTLKEFSSEDKSKQVATEAIFDDDCELELAEKSFVVTGEFEFSKRKPLLQRIGSLGGIFHDNVKRDTDFVIVGLYGSEQWTTKRYGSKIDKAMQMKGSGKSSIKIVREIVVVEYLLQREAQIIPLRLDR